MKTANLILLSACIFMICCSMSQCHEDQTPGPVTTVRGFVREATTGKPIANIQLQIEKEYTRFLEPDGFSDYNVTTTGADGSYYLKFTPLGSGKFFLRMPNVPLIYRLTATQPIVYGPNNGLALGQVDSMNFILTRVYNLSVHLKNDSTHNRTAFHFFIWNCCDMTQFYAGDDVTPVINDRILTYQLPQLHSYMLRSVFYNPILTGPNVGLMADTLSFRKTIYIGQADTAISITNP